MTKLTKDQKREKKKREERKQKLRREHEENRHFKKVDGLMTAITMALEGLGSQEELDAAVLRLAGGQSVVASDKESRFQGAAWAEVKASTTQMVALLQADDTAYYSGLGLQGRLYLNGEGKKRFSVSSMPIFALISSGWDPLEVVHKTAIELEPEPTQGAYFFGMEARDTAVHFAIASTANPDDPPEVFFVSPKGWHRLDLRIWFEELWPCLARVMLATDLARGPTDSQYAITRLVEYKCSSGGPTNGPALDDDTRAAIRSFGSELALESELLVTAAEAARARHVHMASEEQWDAGFESRQDEIDALETRCRSLEREQQALQRYALDTAAPEQPQAEVASPLPSPAKPLHERMGALLGI